MVPEGDVSSVVFFISFAVYTLAIVGVGLYSARFARRSNEDFFLAGRSLGPWVAALSASASSESGWVTLGLVGWAFSSGRSAYWIIPGCLLGYMFNWFIVAGRLRDRSIELGALTLPDFFGLNFRERAPVLRVLSVIVILTAMLLYVAAQLAAAGKAFAVSFDLDYRVGVFIGAGVVLLYTVIGGFRAVCWTDFLQALLMVGTLVIFPIYLLNAHGGFGFISDKLSSADPDLMRFTPNKAGLAFFGFLLGHGALGINLGYPGQPHVLVRFMALRERKEAIVAGVVAVIWGALVYWGAVTIGLMARALTLDGAAWAQPMMTTANGGDLGLVLAAMHLLPGVVAGLVLAAVLAAICSTADSQLVVAASAAANDLYARLFGRAGSTSYPWVNRTVVFLLGAAATWLVYDQEVQIYNYVLTYGWAILGAAFGPQLILALLWKKASYVGCVLGMFTGFVTAIAWKYFMDNKIVSGDEVYEVYNLPLAFIAALIVNVVFSLALPPRDDTTT
jgi:sodium/proline symporter